MENATPMRSLACQPRSVRSICISTSEIAKRPTSSATKVSPPENSVRSKLKRAMPVNGSVPMVAHMRPKRPESRPFSVLPWLRLAMAVSPSAASAKVSAGPKRTAILASAGAVSSSTVPPISPPTQDASVASVTASEERPASAIGCASSRVAAAMGVPGMPSTVAVTAPP